MSWNERAMPRARDGARRQPGDVLAVEDDAAAVRRDAAGEHVEARRLAGAVRAHDAAEPAGLEARA